jgi:orotidine-5'-phosphate decarboxylase
MTSDPRIIVALDFDDADLARQLAGRLEPDRCRVKIGKELFLRGGPALVRELGERGYDVFLDLKFHDIPNTVAGACRAAADLGVWMLNVHALGGGEMLQAARRAVDESEKPPLLIGVTVLTSHSSATLEQIGLQGTPEQAALRLASLTRDCGLDGVVCSAREAPALRESLGADFRLVTPGIRPQGAESGDQTRVMTPSRAIRAGADYLVIGRPITRAPDPLAALAAIEAELAV